MLMFLLLFLSLGVFFFGDFLRCIVVLLLLKKLVWRFLKSVLSTMREIIVVEVFA